MDRILNGLRKSDSNGEGAMSAEETPDPDAILTAHGYAAGGGGGAVAIFPRAGKEAILQQWRSGHADGASAPLFVASCQEGPWAC